jgi:lipid-binding SYLF domain-containing protein
MNDAKRPAGGAGGVGLMQSPSNGRAPARGVLLPVVAGSLRGWLLLMAATLIAPAAMADEYTETINLFEQAGESAAFFSHSYGYAIFPSVGKGGLVLGAAHGVGRVYISRGPKCIGDTAITQVSVGLQAGGETFAEIIFFQNKDAVRDFTSGDYEFGADVSAVVVTAGASGQAPTTGNTASSGGKKDDTMGAYHKGLAVFTIIKGGAMLQAAVGGQKFSYKPRAD